MSKGLRILRQTVIALLLILALFWMADKCFPLPPYQNQAVRIVTAEDGTPLWRFADHNGIWRYPVTSGDISPYYLQALLTYEDRWFWYHPGINPLSILRASWQDLINGRIISGGSTITMQVARLIDPQPRNWYGKFWQIWRALQLEWHLSKAEILTLYLNRAPFGGTLEGVGAASWAWFGKPPAALNRSEAALLAVLPQAPSRLRPDRWPQRAEQARNKVLRRLAAKQVWPQSVVDEVLQEPLWLMPRQSPRSAPLLARRVLSLSKQDKIITTIDASLQQQLEEMVKGMKPSLPARTSMAILVVDHTTMKVRAYIGSVDLNDDSRYGHVDMIRSIRSPGSLLKPFVYALALDDGLIHSESLLQDVPRHFSEYRPGNFDSGFNGPVSASKALQRSLNLPAVQLLEAYGPKRFAATLSHTGLTLRLPAGAQPNLSLILGGAGARMDEMLAAYSAFARQGQAAKLRFLPDQPLVARALTSPGAAWITRQILARKAVPFQQNSYSDVVPLAWKTGTSYGFRDAWALGMNARYLIGVWVGRPDGTPVAGQYGLASALPIMRQVNSTLLNSAMYRGNNLPVDPRPASVTAAMICWPGGQPLAEGDPNCRSRHQSWILNQTIPPTLLAQGWESNSGIRQPVWINDEGFRVAANCPNAQRTEFILWPVPLENWLPETEHRQARLPKPDKLCPPILSGNIVPLIVSGVRNNQTLLLPTDKRQLTLNLRIKGGQGIRRWWFLNGELLPAENKPDKQLLTLTGQGHYQVVVLDEAGQISSVKFDVKKFNENRVN